MVKKTIPQEDKEAIDIEKMITNGEFIEKDKRAFSTMMKDAIKNTVKK